MTQTPEQVKLEEFIDSLPEPRRTRMKQLQWNIDKELAKYKDPIARMNRMVELLWEGHAQLELALNDPERFIRERSQKANTGKGAVVLEFKRN